MAVQAIPMILSGAQMLAGLLSKPDNNTDPITISDSTDNAVKRARRIASGSRAPGRDEAETFAEQATADAVGAAKRTLTDPNQIAGVISRANTQRQRTGQRLDASDKAYQRDADAKLVLAEMNKGREEIYVDRENRRREMEALTAKRNLIGAGVGNLLSGIREGKILDVYGKANNIDIGSGGSLGDVFNKIKGFLNNLNFGGNQSNTSSVGSPGGFGPPQ